MSSLGQTIELLNLLGDPTRVRLLALLTTEELTVAELTQVLGLPQSRVSTHLGKLRDASVLRDRKVGSSCFYTLSGLSSDAESLWHVLRGKLADEVLEADQRRLAELRAGSTAESWPESIAGEMERHYSPGRTWEATAQGLLAFVRLGDVLDIGSGDGVTAGLLVGRARSVTCLDRSERVLEAARERLASAQNTRFVQGDMHELPFEASSFDEVLLFNVLTYSESPERVLAEASRVLRGNGTLSLLTLHQHSHLEAARAYGHVHAGYSTEGLAQLLKGAGLGVESIGVALRERRKPYFEVVAAVAAKAAQGS